MMLDPSALPGHAAVTLFRNQGHRITIEWPSPHTGGQYKLTTRGCIGYLPVTEDLALAIRPKVPVQNVFGMLEYAYRLKSFEVMDGLYGSATLEELYSKLASVFARRVSDRVRRGLLREYGARTEALPYLRGRLETAQLHRFATRPLLPCRYEEHGADIEDNRILLWTLFLLARVEGLHRSAKRDVRLAFRALRGRVTLVEVSARECVGRAYHRLNQDYEPLHALCRLFLETRGPEVSLGERKSVPFLVDMDRLYERFVFEWLKRHLPRTHAVRWQEKISLSEEDATSWK